MTTFDSSLTKNIHGPHPKIIPHGQDNIKSWNDGNENDTNMQNSPSEIAVLATRLS